MSLSAVGVIRHAASSPCAVTSQLWWTGTWNCKPNESFPRYAALCQGTVMTTEMKAGHGVKQHSQQMGIERRELLDAKFPTRVGRKARQQRPGGQSWQYMDIYVVLDAVAEQEAGGKWPKLGLPL